MTAGILRSVRNDAVALAKLHAQPDVLERKASAIGDQIVGGASFPATAYF